MCFVGDGAEVVSVVACDRVSSTALIGWLSSSTGAAAVCETVVVDMFAVEDSVESIVGGVEKAREVMVGGWICSNG